MTAPAPLHPNTLAAHLQRLGFKRAVVTGGGTTTREGFAIYSYDQPPHLKTLRYLTPSGLDGAAIRAELEKMIAVLDPDFDVAEDLGSRVVVRRAVRP